MKPAALLTALLAPCYVQATAVFAHFMVGNTARFTVDDWISNMDFAMESHIDAFALNIAYGWPDNYDALSLAFKAAAVSGFKLFFSFDYAGNGAWPLGNVSALIQQYGNQGSYYKYNGKPFVSTFEGPDSADDWITIKQDTGCFFMPDWSSRGAGPAMALGNGVADGLFSWAAWPYGTSNMTTYVDASYNLTLTQAGGKPYMMPVSPWFYTNLPGYDKNWAWGGGNLWYDRWLQVWAIRPEFVEIISWNDFGESHYIGPLDTKQYDLFDIGEAPFNYADGMPHDAWRAHLPFMIDTYKNLNPSIGDRSIVTWYRKSPGAACRDGGTTGNTASQEQFEYEPASIFPDRLYVAALMDSPPSSLAIFLDNSDSSTVAVFTQWDHVPDGGVGIYQTSIPFADLVDKGSPIDVEVYFGSSSSLEMGAKSDVGISSSCDLGLTNWNAITAVGYPLAGEASDAKAPLKLSEQVCLEGYARSQTGNFNELCQFTCEYGYCPIGACVCTKLGRPKVLPRATAVTGYPANGDANYAGLCSFACTYGFCPSDACATTPQPQYIPNNSPFENPACTAGHNLAGFEAYTGLCSYACNFGFCPMHVCACTSVGYLHVPPTPTAPGAKSDNGDDAGLCDFACSRGYCPAPCFYELDVIFPDDSCTDLQKAMLKTEMGYAYDMAMTASNDPTFGDFYSVFFSDDRRNNQDFMDNLGNRYGRMANIISGVSRVFSLSVTCNNDPIRCGDRGWQAHMSDSLKRVNFCPNFFEVIVRPDGRSSEFCGTLLQQCDTLDLAVTSWGKCTIIVHESAHTSHAMMDEQAAVDVAYGYTDCMLLADGKFDRSCAKYSKIGKAVCGQNGVEGICPATRSGDNADTYSIVAAGIYFTQKCGKTIPAPPPRQNQPSGVTRRDEGTVSSRNHSRDLSIGHVEPASGARLQRRDTSCPYSTDAWPFDGDDSELTITGLAHFGDSYASGMGTGTTTTDACRIGSSNYGQLIYDFIEDSSVSFQRLSCSGDTTVEFSEKLKNWNTMATTNVATLTLGGNDVFFSEIVTNCVLTPNPARYNYRTLCVASEKKAQDHMRDTSEEGLPARLKNSYIEILQKAGHNNLGLYVTGYPEFFNNETTTCAWSTFNYLRPGYKNWLTWDPWFVFLTQPLRTELNGLVTELNSVIEAAVDAANAEWGGAQVTYVDMVEPWRAGNDHRWCANNDVYEPDSTRDDTWFFLSGWPDVDNTASTAQDNTDLSTLIAAGGINLPDGATCNTTLGTGPDPWAWWLCQLAQEILAYPDSDLAHMVTEVNDDIRSGDYTATNVSYFYPTRQIKTFHPRTPGMYAFRDAVVGAIQSNGQI